MNKPHDPELEHFKRTVDLADYAKRAGYEPRPQDSAAGLTVLDHQNSDRIVVGRHPNGQWVYASVPDYVPRSPGEPENEALSRLRSAIGRSQDKGTIVEFIQQRDPRTIEHVVPLEIVRARLRSFGLIELPLDTEGALAPPPYPRGRERAVERGGDSIAPERSLGSQSELNRRRYDWSQPVANGPRETEVERRLREWREAQAAIDRRQRAPREVQPPSPQVPPPAPLPKDPGRPIPGHPPADRGATPASPGKSELGRRRYDWTPAPPGLDALLRGPRGPGRER
ncbi:MAG: hypothetical protein ACRENE_18705 [Polyangiaceae bacterium]